MKKGFVVLSMVAVMAFAASSLFSQGWGGGPGRGNGYCGGPGGGPGGGYGMGFRFLDRMKYDLGLSDEQVKKIFDLGTRYRDRYFENRGSYDKMESVRSEHRKEIEKILTKEQAEKFRNYYGFGGGRGPGRGCGNCY